jgi:thymidylate kinase
MQNIKLILIEGLPGAGKSTTTIQLGTILNEHGIACNWFLEDAEPHPIACLDFELKGLSTKMVPFWTSLVNRALIDPVITIIESRLWQNTALFMYMSDFTEEEIIAYTREVWQVLTLLEPVLVFLDQVDVEKALRRMYSIRGEQWMQLALGKTTQYAWFQKRNVNGFAGWVKFFEAWQPLAERLYADWPFQKIRVLNPHEDWQKAYAEICTFLDVFPPK